MFTFTERCYLTEDGRVVADGDPYARWLYGVPGKKIPLADAVAFGLIDPPATEDADEVETQPEDAGEPSDDAGDADEVESVTSKVVSAKQPRAKKLKQEKP